MADTELKPIERHPAAAPITNGAENDDQPLLKPSPPPRALLSQAVSELEKKYDAYVRNDVYGTMGRGPLPLKEKLLLLLAFLTIVPIRVVLGTVLLVIYYVICKACTAFKESNKEEENEGQEDYAHLIGWRRVVIVKCGKVASRAMLFLFGFYWISTETRGDHHSGAESECKNQPDEDERSGRSVAKLPLVGLISKCLGCVYVQRESKSSDFKGVSGVVTERVQEAHQNKEAPLMMLFPEGTTTNGDYLLPFKTGAFLAKVPVLPVILRYPYRRFSPAWDSISGV